MKKRFGFVLGVLCTAFAIGMCAVKAPTMLIAEGEESTEVTFAEKVYTYEDENGTMVLTLTSETEFSLVMTPVEGEAISGTGTYTRDGNVITLVTEKGEMKISVNDETMTFAEYEEVFECKVSLSILPHGSVEVDKEEGHVGEIVTVTANPDLFYLVEFAEVNGSRLIEDENIRGVYKFALVEGDNKITVKFAVDSELLGEMSVIYEQAMNKDWTNLFSLENVVRVISFILSSGLLIAMVRYFIKDKRIEKNVENSVKSTCEKIVPETTRNAVAESVKEVCAPMFAETTGNQHEIVRVVGVLVKCIALMVEDTPDSRRAILAELSNLNIGDMKVVENAKKVIEEFFASKMSEMQDTMNKLDKVIEKNKELANKTAEISNEPIKEIEENGEPSADDGTQI